MPSGVSPSFVTHTILVSAFVYWAGSRTKSKASRGVTPRAIAVPSPRIIVADGSSLPRVPVQLRHRDEAGIGEPGGAVLRDLAVLRAGGHLDERLARRVLDEDDRVPLVVLAADHDGVGAPLPQDPSPDALEHRTHTVAVTGVRVATGPGAVPAVGAFGELQQVEHHDRCLELALDELLDLLLGRSDRHRRPSFLLLRRARDRELRIAFGRQVVVEVGDQVGPHGPIPGVVPQVPELARVLVDPVQLAFSALVGDGAARPALREAEASGDGLGQEAEELLEPVGLPHGAGLVRRAQPAVTVDRAHVHPVAGELAVPLAQRALTVRAGRGRQGRALHRLRRLDAGDG